MYPNPATHLLLPNTRCDISATACAHRYQRVTVEADGNTTTFGGGSSLNRLPMTLPDGRTEHYTLDAKPYDRTYTLKFESQNPDGSWRPSILQNPVYGRRGSAMTCTLHAEDGEDGDYRDISLVLSFTP